MDKQGHPVCRWQEPASGTTDLVSEELGRWRILQYDGDHGLKREAEMTGEPGEPLATEIRFSSHGLAGYSLNLTLIEAEFLSGECETLFFP